MLSPVTAITAGVVVLEGAFFVARSSRQMLNDGRHVRGNDHRIA